MNLEVLEDLSTMATLFLGRGGVDEQMGKEQQKARRKPIFEVQTWRQVRGPAGAVSARLVLKASKWPQWHVLLSEGQVAVDMRVVCPQDVKHILMKQARMEGLKEEVWLVPIRAMLRRKTNEAWTDKHSSVMRKLFVEGGWVQKRLCGIGWSDETKCGGCDKEAGTEKRGLHHCPLWREVRNQIPEVLGKCEPRGQDIEGIVEVAKRNHVAPSRWKLQEEKPLVSPKAGI